MTAVFATVATTILPLENASGGRSLDTVRLKMSNILTNICLIVLLTLV